MSDWLEPFLELSPQGLFSPHFDALVDPHAAAPRAIVSHAHADHAAAGHGEIWATPETIALYRLRHPDWTGEARAIAYGERVQGAGAVVEAFPSGHILGAAQFRFQDGENALLYTGDFRRSAGGTSLPAQSPAAATLLTESTFGLPVFRFPPRSIVEQRLIETCREAFERGETPVVLAYALGKAQDAAATLTQAGIPTVLHGAAWKLLPEFEAAGHTFPLSRLYESGPPRPGEALLVPPRCARTPVVEKVKKRRIVYLSGWAVRSASRADHDADVLLPWSDHADFPELLEHVAATGARRVVTHHGYAHDFVRILTGRSIPARALEEESRSPSQDAESE